LLQEIKITIPWCDFISEMWKARSGTENKKETVNPLAEALACHHYKNI